MLGPRATSIYLGSIAGCALAFGLAVDWLYLKLGLDTARWLAGPGETGPGLFSWACAALLLGLMAWTAVSKR